MSIISAYDEDEYTPDEDYRCCRDEDNHNHPVVEPYMISEEEEFDTDCCNGCQVEPAEEVEVIDITSPTKRNFPQFLQDHIDYSVNRPAKRIKIDESASTVAKLLSKPRLSDITIHVRGTVFNPCFKSVLANQSEVFKSMMYGNGAKICGNQLNIGDITPEAFDFIQKHCHELNPEITASNIVDVSIAAERYKINAITEKCNQFLSKIDKVDDLLSLIKVLVANGVPCVHLLESNTEMLQRHGDAIIASDAFKLMPFEEAKRLIQSDDLGVKEEALFEVAKQWNTPENREELKRIIRFGRMEQRFIHDTVKSTGILNNDELCKLYECHLGLITECPFSTKERNIGSAKKSRSTKTKKKTKTTAKKAPKKKTTPKKKKGVTSSKSTKKTAQKKKTTKMKKKTTPKKKGKKSSAKKNTKTKKTAKTKTTKTKKATKTKAKKVTKKKTTKKKSSKKKN